jgi:hypothetical protein
LNGIQGAFQPFSVASSSIPAMPLVFNSADSAAIRAKSSAGLANAADADRSVQITAI